MNPSATRFAFARERELYLTSFDAMGSTPPRLLARHDQPIWAVTFHPDGERLAFAGEEGEIRILSLGGEESEPVRILRGGREPHRLGFDPGGTRLLVRTGTNSIQIWDLTGPPGAAPLALGQGALSASIDPSARWIATGRWMAGAILWPLAHEYPLFFPGHTGGITSLVFAPDGSWLASSDSEGAVRIWPLKPESGQRGRVLFQGKDDVGGLEVDPGGRNLLFVSNEGWAGILSLDDGRLRVFGDTLEDYREQQPGDPDWQATAVTFSPDGRLVAEGGKIPGETTEEDRVIIRVWDLDSGDYRVLDPHDRFRIADLRFLSDGSLLSTSRHFSEIVERGGLRLWDLRTGTYEQLPWALTGKIELGPDGKSVWFASDRGAVVYDLEARESRAHPFGTGYKYVQRLTFDPTGKILVTSHGDGSVSVGPVEGGDRHLFLPQEATTVAVSPDGRWIAVGGEEGHLSLWPMPEGTPFHTLPFDELLDRLRSLTNLRVVPDPDQASGYKYSWGPFPGWDTVPTW